MFDLTTDDGVLDAATRLVATGAAQKLWRRVYVKTVADGSRHLGHCPVSGPAVTKVTDSTPDVIDSACIDCLRHILNDLETYGDKEFIEALVYFTEVRRAHPSELTKAEKAEAQSRIAATYADSTASEAVRGLAVLADMRLQGHDLDDQRVRTMWSIRARKISRGIRQLDETPTLIAFEVNGRGNGKNAMLELLAVAPLAHGKTGVWAPAYAVPNVIEQLANGNVVIVDVDSIQSAPCDTQTMAEIAIQLMQNGPIGDVANAIATARDSLA